MASSTEFRQLIEDFRELYTIATEIATSDEYKNVVIENGELRPTWHKAVRDLLGPAIENAGYEILGDYAPGIELTSYGQVLRYNNEFYRLSASVNLPYTTSGSSPNTNDFLTIGDAQLRSDLQSNGFNIVGDGSQTLAQALNKKLDQIAGSITVNIPTDYPDLQQAVDDLSKLKIFNGVKITLMIESGHSPLSGVTVSNGDYGHFEISSIDSVVNTAPSFSGSAFIDADNARAPTLNTLVDFGGAGAFNGVRLNNNSTGIVNPGCGVKNGYGRGLQAENGSTAVADSAVFTGFQQAGVHSSRASTIQCSYAVLTDNSLDPANTFGAIYASRASRIHGQEIDAQRSGGDGVRAQRGAIISVPGINVSEATKIALVAVSQASIYSDTPTSTMQNLKGRAVVAQHGAVITIGQNSITFSSSSPSPAVEARSAATISMPKSSISGHTAIGVYATDSSTIDFREGVCTGGSSGIWCEHTSTVNAVLCTISGASGNGVFADEGSRVSVDGGSVSGNSANDLSISAGSTISAVATTTTNGSPAQSDTNLPGGFNLASNGSRGIIWA